MQYVHTSHFRLPYEAKASSLPMVTKLKKQRDSFCKNSCAVTSLSDLCLFFCRDKNTIVFTVFFTKIVCQNQVHQPGESPNESCILGNVPKSISISILMSKVIKIVGI